MKNLNFKIKLVARNEGIDYLDQGGAYKFNVGLHDNEWSLYLPASKDDCYPYQLTDEELHRIVPRIREFLTKVKWFGLFGGPYTVKVIDQNKPQ